MHLPHTSPSYQALAHAESARSHPSRRAPQAEEIDDEPPLDDGLPADHPRCALCHRCATPVLALPAPASPSAAVTTATAATTAAVTSALVGAVEPVCPPDAHERVLLLTEASMAVDEPAEQVVVAAADVDADAGAADGVDPIARASRCGAPAAAQEGKAAAVDAVMGEAVAPEGAKEELVKAPMPREQSGDLPASDSTAAAPAAAVAAVAAAGEVVVASCTVRQAGGCGLGPLVPVKGGSLPAPCLVHSQCALWSPDVFVIGGSMVGG